MGRLARTVNTDKSDEFDVYGEVVRKVKIQIVWEKHCESADMLADCNFKKMRRQADSECSLWSASLCLVNVIVLHSFTYQASIPLPLLMEHAQHPFFSVQNRKSHPI